MLHFDFFFSPSDIGERRRRGAAHAVKLFQVDKNRPKTSDKELQLPKMILKINNFAAMAFLGALGKIYLGS